MMSKQENKLAYSRAYLIGPIDRVEGLGIEWRLDMSAFLWSNHIGVLNPCDKPTKELWSEGEEWAAYKKELKLNNKDKLHNEMAKIAAFDLRCVDICDFAIMHVDIDVHTCGSYNEQAWISLQRKPILIHCKQGKNNVPDWLFGVCKHSEFFSTWVDLKDYITQLAYTDFKPHKRWQFLDYSKVYKW